MTTRKDYLRGPRIDPRPITGKETVTELVDNAFLAYNAGRLAEGCRLFAERMLAEDVTVGMSLTGAMTPAGLGMSTMIPLIEAGFVDWIVSTGANLYHDSHFGLGLTMHKGTPFADDVELREEGVVRIYDIFFDYQVLLSTDAYIREVSARPEFQRPMSTAEYHYLLGGYVREREQALGIGRKSVLGVAHECGVPIYTSSPGDSSIGMNVAEQALTGSQLRFDVSADVNETSAVVFHAKTHGGKSGVLIIGGGSPKNFVLQTEPQIQEVLGIGEKGHDYYLQMTDARPDTGGLSGATPSEAVSWGKVDPEKLPDTVVCYLDNTVGFPILAAYALAKRKPRRLKRLYHKRDEMLRELTEAYQEAKADRDARAEATPVGRSPRPGSDPKQSRAYAVYALGLLTLINLLNYTDRNVVFALFQPLKRELALTDHELGWLGSAYVIVLSLAALPLGVVGDLKSRRAVIAFGVGLWSAFTALGAAVRGFGQLLVCRAMVGVGEAGYGPAAQALIAEFFRGRRRAFAIGVYSVGMAFGGVLGIWLGGVLAERYGWRTAFIAMGAPGLVLALLASRLREPQRQAPASVWATLARWYDSGVRNLVRPALPLAGLTLAGGPGC